jgi:hypothetical protein
MSRLFSGTIVGLLLLSPIAVLAQEDLKKEAGNAADVPIRRVVMFNSGVAYFEHEGKIEGDAQVDLKFNVRDINDLLKSMVLQDQGGGTISTVTYGSKDPVTRTLQTFSIDLTGNPTLAGLLEQIRGERIEIDAPNPIAGVIVGVETRKTKVKDSEEMIETTYLNLLTEEGLRSVPLESVGRIKLADPKLNAELRQALTVLAQSNSADKKTVTLKFLGEGERPVFVGYVQEAPVWKTSYRLVLGGEEPLLQGWAIVENTTESDWSEVDLTLVSGRPISFVMDLYEPLYVDRPVVEPELYASLRPRIYDQDLAKSDAEFRKAAEVQPAREQLSMDRARRALSAAAPPAAAAPEEKAALGRRLDLQQGVQAAAQAGELGELFQYRIKTPVTLARSRSAMLPIVNEQVAGEKLSIYNQQVHAKHPLNGLRLKNTTKLHLMQGPITVFDDGAYAGDARIEDMQPGGERLISYAMDLAVEVAPTTKNEPQQLVGLKLVKGTLTVINKYSREQKYVVKNSADEARKVLIEFPLDPTWKLVEPKTPTETTRDQYRFAVEAAPGEPAELTIRQEYTSSEAVAVTNLQIPQILFYVNAKTVSEEIKTALREVVQRKQQIDAVVSRRQELERQITVIQQEQERIRKNMEQLPQDSDLYRRYIKKFTEQEDEIEALRRQVTAAVGEEQKLRKELDEFLAGLNLG